MPLLSLQPSSACPDKHEVAARTQHIRGLHLVLLEPSKYDEAVLKSQIAFRGRMHATRPSVILASMAKVLCEEKTR